MSFEKAFKKAFKKSLSKRIAFKKALKKARIALGIFRKQDRYREASQGSGCQWNSSRLGEPPGITCPSPERERELASPGALMFHLGINSNLSARKAFKKRIEAPKKALKRIETPTTLL